MNSHASDILPQTPGISAVVRRIVFRLNAALYFNGHAPLTDRERAAFFDLGDASRILDFVAVLPRMSSHEDRARRDLVELFERFTPAPPPAPQVAPVSDAHAWDFGRATLERGLSVEQAEAAYWRELQQWAST